MDSEEFSEQYERNGISNYFGKLMSSGGWNSKGKREADGVKKISTQYLNEHDFFCGWRSGLMTWTDKWSDTKSVIGVEVKTMNDENYLRVSYTQTNRNTGEKNDFDYKIPILTTPCNYGGKRYWFICPMSKNGKYCGRRVSILYKNGDYFACRHCYNLTYASRNVGGRYKGFVSALGLDEMLEKIKRTHYRGKPTRKYKRYLEMEKRFDDGFLSDCIKMLGK